jgi:membrane protease YdiL (CAAX protease family)
VNDRREEEQAPRHLILASAAVLYGLLLISALIWSFLRTGDLLPESLRGGRPLESLGLGLALGLAVIGLTGVLMRRDSALHWFAIEVRTLLGPVDWGMALKLGLLSGIGEEAFFRGAMQPVFGFVLTSLIFGLIHVGPDRRYLTWTAFAVVMGFLLGGIQVWTGSIVGPLVAHILVNVVNLRRIGRLPPPA